MSSKFKVSGMWSKKSNNGYSSLNSQKTKAESVEMTNFSSVNINDSGSSDDNNNSGMSFDNSSSDGNHKTMERGLALNFD
jgi:hypothetical protein